MLHRLFERRSSSWDAWSKGGDAPARANGAEWGPWYACVAYLADRIASLPVDTYRRGPDGTPVPLATPSSFADRHTDSQREWVWGMVHELANEGRLLVEGVALDSAGQPSRWIPRAASEWQWVLDAGRLVPRRADGSPFTGPVRVRRWRPALGRPTGLSPRQLFAGVCATGLNAEEFVQLWFEHGAHPTSVVEVDAPLTLAQADAIQDRLANITRGSRRPLVLGKGSKLHAMQTSPKDSAVHEHLSWAGAEACRIHGLRPEVMSYSAGGTALQYSNVESQVLDEMKRTFLAWIRMLEELWTSMTPRPQYVKLNTGALLFADTLTRYQAHEIALRSGMSSVDERRALEDEGPVPGGLGKVWRPLVMDPGQTAR
jgi:hypothetical protein